MKNGASKIGGVYQNAQAASRHMLPGVRLELRILNM